MIYITGDTHGEFERFSNASGFPAKSGDTVIVCGDFGGIFKGDKAETYWLDWLEKKPFTVLFLDGNHENFDRLAAFPVEPRFGGNVHRIRRNVFHLMRGYVFEIDGKTAFVMGGAASHDIPFGVLDPNDPDFAAAKKRLRRRKQFFRVKHESWWEEELPNNDELERGLASLAARNHRVDLILSHCAPTSVQTQIGGKDYLPDRLTDYLENVKASCRYDRWYFGHYHGALPNVGVREFADNLCFLGEDTVCLDSQA